MDYCRMFWNVLVSGRRWREKKKRKEIMSICKIMTVWVYENVIEQNPASMQGPHRFVTM